MEAYENSLSTSPFSTTWSHPKSFFALFWFPLFFELIIWPIATTRNWILFCLCHSHWFYSTSHLALGIGISVIPILCEGGFMEGTQVRFILSFKNESLSLLMVIAMPYLDLTSRSQVNKSIKSINVGFGCKTEIKWLIFLLCHWISQPCNYLFLSSSEFLLMRYSC